MKDQKITNPLYEAIRNSLIVLCVAGLRSAFIIIIGKESIECTSDYMMPVFVWIMLIIGVCFGHAYLGNKIGRLKSGLIVGTVFIVLVAIVLRKIMS